MQRAAGRRGHHAEERHRGGFQRSVLEGLTVMGFSIGLDVAGLSFRPLLLAPGQKQGSWSSSRHHTSVGGPFSHRHRVHPLQLPGEDLHLQGASVLSSWVCLGATGVTPGFGGLSQGTQYWRFENGVVDQGFPKLIQTGFDGLRGHITAALSVPQHRQKRESVYFFKRGDENQT